MAFTSIDIDVTKNDILHAKPFSWQSCALTRAAKRCRVEPGFSIGVTLDAIEFISEFDSRGTCTVPRKVRCVLEECPPVSLDVLEVTYPRRPQIGD